MSRVVIVGGGLSGLLAARELSSDHDVTVLEAREHLGGAIMAATLAGVVTDVGAESFAVARPEARALVDELGLSDRVVAPARSDAHLWVEGTMHDLPVSLLGVPVDLGSTEVRALLGDSGAAAAAALDALPFIAPEPGTTLGALVRSRMGDDVVRRIVTPVVAGVHAIDPDLVEADAVAPGLVDAAVRAGSLAGGAAALRAGGARPGAAVNGLEGGMASLITALVDQMPGVRAVTQAAVDHVGLEHGHWHLHVDGRGLDADAVVLAVPAPTAARLLDLPDVAAPLRAISVGEVAVVSLVVDSVALDAAPVGSGVLVAPDQDRVRAKALTHATAKWAWLARQFGPGRHLLRLSYGRNGVLDEDLDTLPAQALADASLLTGVPLGGLVDSRVTRWPDSLVHARPGHRARVDALAAAVAQVPGLAVIGAGLGGNGIAGTVQRARSVHAQLAAMGE